MSDAQLRQLWSAVTGIPEAQIVVVHDWPRHRDWSGGPWIVLERFPCRGDMVLQVRANLLDFETEPSFDSPEGNYAVGHAYLQRTGQPCLIPAVSVYPDVMRLLMPDGTDLLVNVNEDESDEPEVPRLTISTLSGGSVSLPVAAA